jgi:D-galactarolactone cycloisomerase
LIRCDSTLRPSKVDAHVFRYPIATSVRTSFGVMHDRPAVLVRVEDGDGTHGWGEAWCNFPSCGAEHRARLIESVLAPLLCGAVFASPDAAFDHLTAATAVLALQSGEPGPISQSIAGLDLALWDLVARRAGAPLWRLLGGPGDQVGVYASGINPDTAHETVLRKRAEGFRAFKLKIGFGAEQDIENLRQVFEAARPHGTVMVDANQAWDLATALDMAERLNDFELSWLEEPLRADRPWSEWLTLRHKCRAPLAAGENIAGEAAFDALLAAGAVSVVQPDIAKWGGISGCLPVIRRIHAAGLRHCPHYLGAGIGLLHSAHLLAATGGDGLLEVDSNDNPLRTMLCGGLNQVDEGSARLGEHPGIGIEPDLARLRAACAGRRAVT